MGRVFGRIAVPSSSQENRARQCSPCFEIYSEKVVDEGEDAAPICSVLSDGSALVGVFDGLGGSGSMRYVFDGLERSGAYFASRQVRAVVDEMFLSEPEPACEDLASAVSTRLDRFDEQCGRPRPDVRSKMLRVLPTTMAVAHARPELDSKDMWQVRLLWSGDSRIYGLLPSGLTQLTRDHLASGGDPFDNIYNDSRMSQCISLGTELAIEEQTVALRPCILIAATDGCFQYVRSPMHFEHMLLETMQSSGSFEQWHEHLQDAISSVAQDDATLAAIGLFNVPFDTVCTAWRRRYHELSQQLAVVDGPDAPDDDPERARLTRLWEQYSQAHLQYARYEKPTTMHPASESELP